MSPTLLLADDSTTIQRVIELTFAEHGITVNSVSDGQEAIDYLAVRRPDIALVGVSLQKRDGYEVAGFFQRQPSLRGVPVLLVAGAFETLDEARVRESGAVGVFTKPFESKQVINRVKELLGLSARQAEPNAGDRPDPPLAGRLVTISDGAAPRGADDDAATAGSEGATQRAADAAHQSTNLPPRGDSAWTQLRQDTGLATDAASVEGPDAGGEEYFGHLDEAFDTLDAQLAGKVAASERATNPVVPSPYPAALDPGGRRPVAATPVPGMDAPPSGPTAAAPPSGSAAGAVWHSVSSAGVNPVFEIDDKWFPAKSTRDASDPPAPLTSPAMADAFAMMLAQEQGEVVPEPEEAPGPQPYQAAPIEISDDVIDRIAQRVVDRLMAGALGDRVSTTVHDVSERLVREEIARIRAAASAKNS